MHSCIAPTRKTTANRQDITVIILAANIGYGMKSYGPKSLLTITEKDTLLECQIKIIRQIFPLSDIILVVGFYADRLIRRCPQGVRIIENQLFENTNEAEQIRLALNATLTEHVLIIKDDIVFNEETFGNISKSESCIIYDSKNQIDSDNIGVTVVDGHVNNFVFGTTDKWCHIAFLTSKELKIVKTICANRENSRLYFFEILNTVLNKVEKIRAIEPINMEIFKIDNSRYLEKAKA